MRKNDEWTVHQVTEGFYVLGSSESSMVLVQEEGF